MTPHEINILIERYLDGETTLAEERALALAVQREDRPAEWAIIAEMLGELTVDEAVWTLPQPLPEWRGEVTTSINSSQETAVSTPLHSGRGRGWVRWTAAACVAIAFALSYNIKKEEPQETAKVGPQETTKVEPQETAEVEPQETTKVEPPLPAKNAPSEPVLSCDWSHDRTAAPRVKSLPSAAESAAVTPASKPDTTPDSPHLEPLPEIEPQLIAEAQKATPQPEDHALYMALLTEVEARAVMLQQTQQTHPQPLPEWRGEVTSSIINLSENVVSTPSLLGRDGVGLLLDELLANIQQQSNRPELSL